jgi:hypothetical protein
MAQAALAEEARLAQQLAEQASAATPGQGSERPRQDLVNPWLRGHPLSPATLYMSPSS